MGLTPEEFEGTKLLLRRLAANVSISGEGGGEF
jgi:hypothetical protein